MKDPADNMRGGYRCPVEGCTRRFFIPQFLTDHLRDDHPDHRKDADT